MSVKLRCNGACHSLSAGDRSLLSVLRNDLGLTGAKRGCDDKGECRTCAVLLNDQPILSCVYPLSKVGNRLVTTIEGLAPAGGLHPLQEAFVELGAAQCGYCIPGMIVTAEALLRRNPSPSRSEVIRVLRHNLCRCGAYGKIADAVLYGAALRRKDCQRKVRDRSVHLVGSHIPQLDAREKVTGQTKYVADLTIPGMLHAKTLRSPHHHAQILGIDTSEAEAMEGVEAVMTQADTAGRPQRQDQYLIPVIPSDWVRYLGEPVAVVAAVTEELAEQALSKIRVDYQILDHVLEIDDAIAPNAPQLHKEGNFGFVEELVKGDIEAGFLGADVIVERTYRTPIQEHAPMETEGALSYLDPEGILTVLACTQIAYVVRDSIAHILGLPTNQVRVIGTPVGGGFGGKSSELFFCIASAILTWKSKKPVRLIYSREESLLSTRKRHASLVKIKTGATRDGKLVAVQAEVLLNSGAYSAFPRCVIPRHATEIITGPYEVPHIRVTCKEVCTNTPKAGFMRGLAGTQMAFAYEQQMDLLAKELGIDPWELRYRNALRKGSTAAAGNTVQTESEDVTKTLLAVRPYYRELLEEAAAVNARAGNSPWRRGVGLACSWRGHGVFLPAEATVELNSEGRTVVRVGAANLGTGAPTGLAMIAAEQLGVPVDSVSVVGGDTQEAPFPYMTVAESTIYLCGKAVFEAATGLRAAIVQAAAERLEERPGDIEIVENTVRSVFTPSKKVSLTDLVQYAQDKTPLRCHGRWSYKDYEGYVNISPNTGQPLFSLLYSHVTEVAVVEVNTQTGETRVPKVVYSGNTGKVINPLGLETQVEGGILMGLGLALKEDFVPGKSDTFKHYPIPLFTDSPEVVVVFMDDPVDSGPFGAKGAGETPTMAVPAAVANGIADAAGIRIYRLPATRRRVLAAMAKSER